MFNLTSEKLDNQTRYWTESVQGEVERAVVGIGKHLVVGSIEMSEKFEERTCTCRAISNNLRSCDGH